jgi:hypothetical protein
MTQLVPYETSAAWAPPASIAIADVAATILSFLDTASTSMGRATAYVDRATQQAAERAAHEKLFALDRGLYALLLQLPGVTDRARQIGCKTLLAHAGAGAGLLDEQLEALALRRMIDALPATRLLKTFVALRDDKTNNARTRKLVLRVVLGSPKLELWTVKYRRKLEASLTHAWGRKITSIVRAILSKDALTTKEQSILHEQVDRFARDVGVARECVAFVLGVEREQTLPLLVAFERAKTDLSAGNKLPPEVLEGLRGTYHKGVDQAEVLRLTAHTMTEGQKLAVQKRAAAANVDVSFDPRAHDLVRLYLFAYEMGMTSEVAKAIDDKARRAAESVRLPYGRIAIVFDASASMAGSREQRLRPMATALALRDVLAHVAKSNVIVAGGDGGALVRPRGATSLAPSLLEAITTEPDAIFVISDGYENRPAGRVSEIVAALRALGIDTPILHLNPVFAAESASSAKVRSLGVPVLPAATPESLGIAFVRGLIEADPHRGIAALIGLARPRLFAA